MAELVFDYGNMLAEFRGTGTDVDARIAALARYSERRLPGLQKFKNDLQQWLEGGAELDAEFFHQGLAILESVRIEASILSLSKELHEITNNKNDVKRYKAAVNEMLLPLKETQQEAMNLVHRIPRRTLRRFNRDSHHTLRDADELKKHISKKDTAEVEKEIAKEDELSSLEHFGELQEQYGDSTLDQIYQTAGEDAALLPDVAQEIADIITDRLREVQKNIKGNDIYVRLLKREYGIPPNLSQALYAPGLDFTYMEEGAYEAPRWVNKSTVRAKVKEVVEAYTAFSPTLGAEVQYLIDNGHVNAIMPEETIAVSNPNVTYGDSLNYQEWVGNGLLINFAGADEVKLVSSSFGHEVAHGLEWQDGRKGAHGSSDSFLGELLAHVGEYIVLEHRLKKMPDVQDAIAYAQEAGNSEDWALVTAILEGKIHKKLLESLPKDRSFTLAEIRQNQEEAAEELFGFSDRFDPSLSATSIPLDAGIYDYDILEQQSYAYAIIGSRAFAHKLFNASPEERQKMATTWEKVIKNSHKYNWKTALEAVGIDVNAPDFLDHALHFSRDLVIWAAKEHGYAVTLNEDAMITRGKKSFSQSVEEGRRSVSENQR